MEKFKTYFLMTGLTLLFIWFGGLIGGKSGMIMAFLMAAGMNFYAYYYSDKQVLAHYDAVPVDEQSAPGLYAIVRRLTQRAGLPMPRLYIIPDPVPNAFATGRDYEHAAVAVTEGLIDLLDDEEIEGVITSSATSNTTICSSAPWPPPSPEPSACWPTSECSSAAATGTATPSSPWR